MRVFYAVLLLATALFASAIARPGSEAHGRRERSVVFTGEPQNQRFNPSYNPFSKNFDDYSPDYYPESSQFGGYPSSRYVKDHQVDTNDVDQFGDSEMDNGKDEPEGYGGSDEPDFLASKAGQTKLQKLIEALRLLLVKKHSNSVADSKDAGDLPWGKGGQHHDDDYDDDDDDYDDVDDDDDYGEDEEDELFTEHDRASFQKILDFAKNMLNPHGKDFQETTDIDNSSQDEDQKSGNDSPDYDGGFVQNPSDHPGAKFPAVPKSDDYFKGPFYGQHDDYDMKTKDFDEDFGWPKDRGQGKNDEIDASDEFADSDEFGVKDEDKFKGQDEAQDKTPKQDVDSEFSGKKNGNDAQPEPDGRGVIEPRFKNSGRYSDLDNYDFVPNVVQRWKRRATSNHVQKV